MQIDGHWGAGEERQRAYELGQDGHGYWGAAEEAHRAGRIKLRVRQQRDEELAGAAVERGEARRGALGEALRRLGAALRWRARPGTG